MILVALIALAARAAASPARAAASPTEDASVEDARAEAIRYANALTGVDPDDDDDESEDDDEDRDIADDADGDGDDDRVDGSLAEDEDIRRLIAEDGDIQEDRDPAVTGSITGSVTGELAALGGATAPGTIAGDDVSFSAASAGAPETYESWMRHQRPSRWGRLDLGVQWQRRWSEPMQGMSRRHDEVLLVATWRR